MVGANIIEYFNQIRKYYCLRCNSAKMKDKKVPESILKAINTNDFSQFKTYDTSKIAIQLLEWWDSLPEAIQLKILKELVLDDGIYSIK